MRAERHSSRLPILAVDVAQIELQAAVAVFLEVAEGALRAGVSPYEVLRQVDAVADQAAAWLDDAFKAEARQ